MHSQDGFFFCFLHYFLFSIYFDDFPHRHFHRSRQCRGSSLLHDVPVEKWVSKLIIIYFITYSAGASLIKLNSTNQRVKYHGAKYLPGKGSPLLLMLAESRCWRKKTERLRDVNKFVCGLRNRIGLRLDLMVPNTSFCPNHRFVLLVLFPQLPEVKMKTKMRWNISS